MSDPFVPRQGGVLSADIAVPDHEREVRFYARVLSTGRDPLWRESDLMNNLGMPIIGLGARTAEYEQLPLQWMPHIQVADVAASVQRAQAAGGKVVMHARDEEAGSLWAVLLDRDGAAFGIIPVVPADAIPPREEGDASDGSAAGHIRWLELALADASAARDFYCQVVGWSDQAVEMEDGEGRFADYIMLGADGEPVAGICHARGAKARLPPVWLIHLPVGDLTESLRRVSADGGSILDTARSGDGTPTFAAVRDPVGACLALVAG